jgi:tRNA 5-methylaminomethyl-2-thiouridine biosynthesis bifunctional protein
MTLSIVPPVIVCREANKENNIFLSKIEMKELGSAQLGWKENKTPVSGRFDDVYFSVDDGLAESLYVFVHGCGLPDAFDAKNAFNIAETGFGTGLNFLLTWKTWKESNTDCQLNYFSVEAFPLDKDELKLAYANFPDLAPFATEFLDHYPTLNAGFHHLTLEGGKVKLTLMLGDAARMFAQLDGQIDAWYLDGFAPAKNPEMWCEDLFEQIGRLSKRGSVLSTFTAAGFVKRGLRDVGFDMTKRQGFGRKRDSLIGVFVEAEIKRSAPWFAKPEKEFKKQKIAVVGAGIAGCATARRLIADGHDVTLFDRNDRAGLEGSGNRLGLVKPRLTQEDWFNVCSYLHALYFYDHLDFSPWQGMRGLFQMEEGLADRLKLKILVEKKILPPEHMRLVSAEEASALIGINVPRGGLWFSQAGYVEPSTLCQALCAGIETRFNTDITALIRHEKGWQLQSNDETVFDGDGVVLATAGENATLNRFSEMVMRGRRGQVSYVRATPESENVRCPLTCGGYFIPARDGQHIVGATFDHWSDFSDKSYREITEESHERNRNKLRNYFPDIDFEVIGGRASIRAMTPDHTPIVGPVFDETWYKEAYAHLKHGPKRKTFIDAQYVDGLYTICGLGARGVQTAPLLADLLASYISGTPCPLENRFREALHPARFLIRDIRKDRLK